MVSPNMIPEKEAVDIVKSSYYMESELISEPSDVSVPADVPVPSTQQSTSNVSPFDLLKKVGRKEGPKQTEMDAYEMEEALPEGSDVLRYWQDRASVYPVLSKLAKTYLSIPASSGGIERTFSLAGAISNARRARTSVKSMEARILLRENRLEELADSLHKTGHARLRVVRVAAK